MPLSAIVINKNDNVATALQPMKKGDSFKTEVYGGEVVIFLTDPVPSGHKFALKEISRGSPVIKYGEVIGLATVDIYPGQHVHVHNVEGNKGRGDRANPAGPSDVNHPSQADI